MEKDFLKRYVFLYFSLFLFRDFNSTFSFQQDNLRYHILYVHLKKPKPVQKEKPRNMVCELCGKKFTSPSGLLRHSYTHTTEKPFKCHICSKQYPTSYKLKEHVMRHEGIKNYVCTHCGLRKVSMHGEFLDKFKY